MGLDARQLTELTVAKYFQVACCVRDVLNDAPEVLTCLVPEAFTEAEAGSLRASVRKTVSQLPPECLAVQIGPTHQLMDALTRLAAEARIPMALSKPNMNMAVDRAVIFIFIKGHQHGEQRTLVEEVLQAVVDAAYVDLTEWLQTSRGKAIKFDLDNRMKGAYGDESRRGQAEGSRDYKRPRNDPARANERSAVSQAVLKQARDITKIMGNRESVCSGLLKTRTHCKENCHRLPCNGRSDRKFQDALRKTEHRG